MLHRCEDFLVLGCFCVLEELRDLRIVAVGLGHLLNFFLPAWHLDLFESTEVVIDELLRGVFWRFIEQPFAIVLARVFNEVLLLFLRNLLRLERNRLLLLLGSEPLPVVRGGTGLR